ncbi:tetratricopeptide repeat protein [Aliarcobacter cryaerophilus]|uniref:tetratricopeptide repeat protein n=1 Tax=Aliarcobacter cryaerophilus TaxID=28198 RepID=UPI003DA435EF
MTEQEKKFFQEAIEFYKKKNFDKAKEKYEEILKINPKSSEVYGNLGVIYKIKGDIQNAIKFYVEAIKLNPKNQLVFNNLGNAFREIKNYKMAIRAYSDAVKLNPKDFNAFNNLGIVYESMGDNNRAIEAYKQAVRVNPTHAKSINNIGVVLYKQKRYKESAQIFEIALQTDLNYNEVYSNKGAAYNKAKDYEKAIESLETAIKKMPNHGGAYTNLGNVYNKLFDYKTAAKMHEKSIELEPNGSNAYSNLGTSYKYLGFSTKAINSYKKAIEIDPNFVNAHFDLATMYLANEDFSNGWKEYEWRFKKEEMIPHIIKHKDIFSKPLFTGIEDIKGKTLLLHSEQGYGDSIQFIRFAPVLKEKFGCKIAVKCREGLKELFQTMPELDVIVDRSEATPEFDYQLSIMSMPFVLGMKSINDLPKQMPYLKSTPDKALEIKKEKGKINIGICWSASITGESYEGKVFDLKYFEPLMNNPKINLYSLQVGDGSEDIKKLGFEDKITDLTSKLTDFSKTAYLIDNLDLVISSDTAVAHLAGALNKEVWIPLQKIPDWRWTNKGETTKWYPSAKLFRQKTARVWEGVFQSLNAKLSKQFKIKIN